MRRIYLQKAKTQVARSNTIRDINRQIVLNYVRERSPISRAEIARETALQRSTISSIIEDLQIANLVEEIGMADSTGGRKATLLQLKTEKPIAVGIDIRPTLTTIAVADLAGHIIEKEIFPTSPNADFMLGELIERLREISFKYSDSSLEVGISLPGIVDQTTGKATYIPYFEWYNWEISRAITAQTGLKVRIDNDANAMALAELWFGKTEIRRNSNFIMILVAEGIGTGIVVDGQVYRGDRGAAGEFGHMVIGEKSPVACSCGNFDCLEAHTSETATIERYQRAFGNRFTQNGNTGIEQIISLALRGEEQAVKTLKHTAKYLGIGISNLIVGLSPQAIVIGGKITKVWDIIQDDLSQTIDRSIRRGLPATQILPSSLEANPTLMGAISLVLARKFAFVR